MSTTDLATGNNLKTTLRLLQDNDGNGNVVVIKEGNNGKIQPTYCVTLKLTCLAGLHGPDGKRRQRGHAIPRDDPDRGEGAEFL